MKTNAKILIIGGTGFVGSHFINHSTLRPSEITIAHRGNLKTKLPAYMTNVFGSHGELPQDIAKREWDIVYDFAGYDSKKLRRTLELLGGNTGIYCYLSSISAYDSFCQKHIVEDAPTVRYDDPTRAEYDREKSESERILKAYHQSYIIIRPGVIFGPGDYTNRVRYWLAVARRAKLIGLNQDLQTQFVQLLDVRDLCDWLVRISHIPINNIYNAVGPEKELRLTELIECCQRALEQSTPAHFSDHVDRRIIGHHSLPTKPLMVPPGDRRFSNFFRISNRKAISAGLRFRRLDSSLVDLLEAER